MAHETTASGPPKGDLLSRRDVAALFGVAPQTITRWANEGILPHVWTLGGQRRYPASEVKRIASAVWDSPGAGQGAASEANCGPGAGKTKGGLMQ